MIKKIILVLIILGPSLIFGYFGKPTEMSLAIVGGAITAAFLNIDKMSRFKGAGFEAEMKEAVKEAYATIENLKELGEPLILTTIEILTKEGRFGGMGAYKKHKFKQELEDISKSLDIDNNRLEKIKDKFYRYHVWDHYQEFITVISQDSYVDKEIANKLGSLKKDYSSKDFPKEETIQEIINQVDELEEITQETLKDYIYYKNNKEIRKKEALSRT